MTASAPSPSKATTLYDIAIIGGGIAGTAVALEACQKNLKTILFEKNTVGSGTSSKSSKLIHGGLRYLEIAWSALLAGRLTEFWKNLRFVFLALRETHTLARQWPDLIDDIELLMPIYSHQKRNRWSVFFGTWLYGFLSFLSGGKHFTRIVFSAESVLKLEPGLEKQGLLGAVIVWDHTTDDLALVKRLAETAQNCGAVILEQTSVQTYRKLESEACFEVVTPDSVYQARKVINAGGAWVDQIRQSASPTLNKMIVPVAGSHIEVPLFCQYSCILQAGDGRIFFTINRNQRSRVGTTERIEQNPDQVQATEEEIDYLIEGVRSFFPQTAPSKTDILTTDAGIRPLAKPERQTNPNAISREHQFVTDELGVIHVLGVKLTDHRRAAQELLKKIL